MVFLVLVFFPLFFLLLLILYFFFLLINFWLYIIVICLLRHDPPRLAFASCGHALSVYRTKKKIKESVDICNQYFFMGWVEWPHA